MRFDTLFQIAFVALLIGVAVYMRFAPQPAPPVAVAAQVSVSSFTSFCREAHLVQKAMLDCQELMQAAKTDDERGKVERIFSMGPEKHPDLTPSPREAGRRSAGAVARSQ